MDQTQTIDDYLQEANEILLGDNLDYEEMKKVIFVMEIFRAKRNKLYKQLKEKVHDEFNLRFLDTIKEMN